VTWIFTPDGFLSITKAYEDFSPKDDLFIVSSKFRGHIETALPQYIGRVSYDPERDLPYFAEVFFYDIEEIVHKSIDEAGVIDLHEHPDIRTHEYQTFLVKIYTEILAKEIEPRASSWIYNLANISKA